MRRTFAPTWMAAAALALVACSSTPTTPPGRSDNSVALVAPHWRQGGAGPAGAADATTLAQWWRALNDPVLAGLVDDALAANQDLHIAQAALERARALRAATEAGLGPQLGSSATASRNRSGGGTGNSLSLGLDASWEPDLFGAAAGARAAAEAQAAGSAASLAATRIAVVGEVALAYLQWQGQRRQIGIAALNLGLQRDSLQVAQWRQGAGLATELDVAQAAGVVEQTQARLAGLQTTRAQSEHRIAVLLGVPPGALGERLATAGAGPVMPPLPAPGLPADLLRRRPDVVAAEWSVTQALATLSQREAERLPQFAISGRLGLQAATLAALSGGSAVVAALGASVSWPIFDGGAARAQVAAQAAALAGARASYQAAVLTAQQDVEDTLVALQNGRLQAENLRRAATAAQQVLALTRARYQAGGIDFSALLDAQRSALSADDSLASAETELALNQVRLYKALGGGWPATDPSP
ncbi:MAG: efflux transporter outer membrane subunit [Burkholderiales bacterium]|nr:efflux transporter outer membrane subunit [Burkholderiales bacterium]